jgi:septum formation protein
MTGLPGHPRVVLASQSPRRRDLLAMIGIAHTVRPADIDETVAPGERALDVVERLARTKARVIAAVEREAVIIGSDTIVVIDNEILNKPVDADDARRMLRALRGRTHVVHTAVAVVTPVAEAVGVETVGVTFRGMTDGEVDAYIATGEPMDKAGAYGIQGYGATIVERIDGDFFAVMGLPLVRLTKLLGEVGVNYQFGGVTA